MDETARYGSRSIFPSGRSIKTVVADIHLEGGLCRDVPGHSDFDTSRAGIGSVRLCVLNGKAADRFREGVSPRSRVSETVGSFNLHRVRAVALFEPCLPGDGESVCYAERYHIRADGLIREMEENSIIPALKDQLHETERSINNLVKMVEKGVESDTIADRLKELEKEKRAIEKRLVVAQDDYVILEKEHIVWWLSDFCNGDIEDEEFRRHIIDLLVNSVTVWDEPDGWYKITSVYNLTSNKTKTFRCSDLSGQAPPKRKAAEKAAFLFAIIKENRRER